jgi:hypothetical protein
MFKNKQKESRRNGKFLWITFVFCCCAAHNSPDKLEDTEKILGLAGQGIGSISKPSKSSRGRKKKTRIKPNTL